MKKSAHTICFLGSAAAFLILAVAVFLFHPATMLSLNQGSNGLRLVASLLFWAGLLTGLALQAAAALLRRKKAPDFARQYNKRHKAFRQRLWKTRLSMLLTACFAVGLVGSGISIALDPLTSYHTFFFIALAVFGLCEYLVFNSINCMYFMRRSEKNEA